MPLYEYINGIGETEFLRCSVDERDSQVGFSRVKVPTSVRTITSSKSPEESQAESVLKGYYEQECKLGSNASKMSTFSAKQIKAAWANN